MKLGVVVIGRNEGERLRACLASAVKAAGWVVYVDSGSTDNSIETARQQGVEVVPLDLSIPFTAGRARNEGFRRLRELAPDVEHVQFVDGDCELESGWLESATRFLQDHAEVGVVAGRLRERHPERSIYNMLCDIEWDHPAGEIKSCGGNALIRADAFQKVGGFRPDVIAGEEPELCVRLRSTGWRLWQLPDNMALHDAAMTRFGQWWRRAKRAGYAFAQGAAMHGTSREGHSLRQTTSAWFWAVGIPLTAIAAVALAGPWGLLVLAIYPLQIIRLALKGGRSLRENWWRAVFLVIGKFPETIGQLKFLTNRLFGRQCGLIEYK